MRLEAAFRVRYRSFDQLVLAWATELSRGRMFLATSRPLTAKARIGLLIDLPEGGGKVRVLAEVVGARSEREAAATGQPAGIHVEFLRDEESSLAPIEEFIDRRSKSRSTSTVRLPVRTPIGVLVVDDEDEYRELAAEAFRRRGDRVRTARDGVEALTLCLQDPPDVILSDLEMPRMDGWNLLRVVRSRAALTETIFLFLTVLGAEEERLRGYQLGVDDYVPKPYHPEEILARVDRLVARMRGSRRAPDREGLRGDLGQVSLASVLSFLELERKTGVLAATGEGAARLFLRDGRLVRVEVEGALADETAAERLHRVLEWTSGQFEFHAGEVAVSDEFRTTTAALLVEHSHLQDERRRTRE
jgi:two-component system OmpR family response regulator